MATIAHRRPRQSIWRALCRTICILTLAAVLGPPGPARAAEPTLTIEPDRAPCGERVIVRGSNFAPGQAITFSSVQVAVRGGFGGVAGIPVVPDDGAFAFELNTRRLGLFCGPSGPPATPDGAQFRLFAGIDTGRGSGDEPRLADALFTVDSSTAPPQPRPGFAPVLTLEPEDGLCTDRVVVRGVGFPPGETVTLTAVQSAPFGSGATVVFAKASADDGSFAAEVLPEAVAVHGCGKCGITGCGADPTEEQYRIAAIGEGTAVARATFTVAGPFPPLCFSETGQCIRDRFHGYWLARGGLDLLGYPLSGEVVATLDDGADYTVQYFERALLILDLRAEGSDYKIALGQLGRRFYHADPPVEPLEGATHFPQTGHNARGRFLDFWQNNGRARQFGFPISEEFEERLEDGRVYTVQYFEHTRFEYHPENEAPYDVLLGPLGRRALAESGR